jgi:DNA-binding CsgD family transcriptional regulator
LGVVIGWRIMSRRNFSIDARDAALLVWTDLERDRVSSALDRARGGRPTVLIIEASAGLGKTALLSELIAQARDFRVLHADGLENDRTPFAALGQWGADPARPTDGGEPSTAVAAQALRDRLDSLAIAGPLLLVLDDLHWADSESVAAILWLLRRTDGDRLLLAVGTRPLPPELHSEWQRWIAGRDIVVRVELTGLTSDQVLQVARRSWPELSEDLGRRLHEHTGGNPLYLSTLLAENDVSELSTTGMLPAPAVFARSIATRTAALPASSLSLLRGICVLGSGWSPLVLAGVTADVENATMPAQDLAESGLIDVRRADGPVHVRPSHALIRASVYQQTSLPQLRILHRQAAGIVATRASALQHLMAAAEQYDDALATEMETYAEELYAQRSFRQAARYVRWASGLTPDPSIREHRWLESVFDLVLTHDVAAVERELQDVRAADDSSGRAAVLGLHAIWGRRYREGIEQLEPVASAPITAGDARTRYRIEVLLAWARLCLGQPTDLIESGLARAATVRTEDAGVSGLELVAGSQLSIRRHRVGPVLAQLSALPEASAVPLAATGALAFRGSVRATLGLTRQASDDLTEATRRIVDGVSDLGAGSFHAQLGFVQWLTGDWDRSRLSLHQALDMSGRAVHQMTAALVPLVDIGLGRFPEADAAIGRARELLTDSPWFEACQMLLSTLLVRAHAGGSTAEQAATLADLRGTPFEVPDITRASPTLLLNYVPALIWAKRLDEADAAANRLAPIEPAALWAPAAADWLRGLVLQARGDEPGALVRLTSALAAGLELPLYQAHLLADHARVAHQLGRPEAQDSARRAEAIYERLGATPYLGRLRQSRSLPAAAPMILSGGVALTEREQDVLTLLVSGLSYAQISRELFITQSTVGYHLSNIYGKAGVASRHQLTELAHRNPRAFGLSIHPDQ